MNKIYALIIGMAFLTSCSVKAKKSEGNELQKGESTQTEMTLAGEKDSAEYEMQASQEDKRRVEQLLKELVPLRNQLSSEELILKVARKFIGIPYVAHTLDKNANEKLVVNLREMDCTTYLENVVALCLCVNDNTTSFDNFATRLMQIRYRGGELSYENRLHYYQWWVSDNEAMGFVKEINAPNPPFTGVQTLKINYMSTNYGSYDMLKNNPFRVKQLKAIEDKTNGTKVNYIPKAQLKNTKLLREIIHDGDLIALTTNKKNLDTTHLGIAVWHKDGLYLLNASSLKKNGKSVVEPDETLYTYLSSRDYNPGIRVARIQLPNIGK